MPLADRTRPAIGALDASNSASLQLNVYFRYKGNFVRGL